MKTIGLLLSALIALPALAANPLAIRVEVTPTATGDDGTTVELSAQLAPEERGRLGHEARLRVRLKQGDDVIAHVLKDVDVDDAGRADASFTWPPGEYTLEVTLEALRGGSRGLWAGKIEIPAITPKATTSPTAVITTPHQTPPAPKADPRPIVSPPTVSDQGVTAVTTQSRATEPETTEPASIPEPADEALPADSLESAPAVQEPEIRAPSVAVPAVTAAETAQPATAPSAEGKPEPTSQEELPVHMVIALDVTADESSRASSIARALEHRALSEGGRSAAFSAYDATTENAPAILRAALHSSVTNHFGAPLVLITDGRHSASKDAWKEAEAAARSGGVPVLAVGLWSEDFPPSLQKRLRKIAAASGGRVFFLQGSDTTATVVALYEQITKANED